jgi:predicted patatin/cPLA2 family phospholipase
MTNLDLSKQLEKLRHDIKFNKFNGFLMAISSDRNLGISKATCGNDSYKAIVSIVTIMAQQEDTPEREKFFDEMYDLFKSLYGEMFLAESMESNIQRLLV